MLIMYEIKVIADRILNRDLIYFRLSHKIIFLELTPLMFKKSLGTKTILKQ